MTRALLGKELREHKWILAALALLLTGLQLSAFLIRKDERGAMADLQGTVGIYAAVVALVLANRLVVREYGARTQLFLEALPITRARVLTVKWLLGAGLGLAFIGGLAVLALWLDRDRTILTWAIAAPFLVRIALWTVLCHAAAFLAGVFGRYRYVFWLSGGFGLYALDQYAQQPLQHLPPVRLIGDGLLTERGEWPWGPLLFAAAAIVVLAAAAATLMLAREGSWVAALARRMSYREKIGVAISAIVPLLLITVFDKRKDRPKFDLAEAVHGASNDVVVGVARPRELAKESAQGLAEQIATDVSGLRDYLGLTQLPAVFVVPDASVDGDLFLRATLPAADGVVVKGALGSPHFDELAFRAFTLHQVLEWYTRGRAEIEERHWLLDGFSLWWVARDGPQAPVLERRARAAQLRQPVNDAALAQWFTTREALGDCLSDALGFEAVATLAAHPAELQALTRDAWGTRPPRDVRALFGTQTSQGLLQKRFGFGRPEFAEQLAATLEKVPAPPRVVWEPSFRAKRMRGSSYEVQYGFEDGSAAPPAFAVRYERLTPWSNVTSREELSRVDATAPGVLPLTVQRGSRLFVAVEARDEALGCTVRAGARRWEIP